MTAPESPEARLVFLEAADMKRRSEQYKQLTEDLAALVLELEAMSDSALAELSKPQPFGRSTLPDASAQLVSELSFAHASALDLLDEVRSIERTGWTEAQNDPWPAVPGSEPAA